MPHHCPLCKYDLTGTRGIICPECGRATSAAFRPRLRKRHLAVAIAVALALVGLNILMSFWRAGGLSIAWVGFPYTIMIAGYSSHQYSVIAIALNAGVLVFGAAATVAVLLARQIVVAGLYRYYWSHHVISFTLAALIFVTADRLRLGFTDSPGFPFDEPTGSVAFLSPIALILNGMAAVACGFALESAWILYRHRSRQSRESPC